MIDFVRRLLEVPNLPNYVRNHSHLGEVQQSVGRKVRRALLDETQVRQVHAQIRNARRIATVQNFAHCPESAVRTDDGLQFRNGLFDLNFMQSQWVRESHLVSRLANQSSFAFRVKKYSDAVLLVLKEWPKDDDVAHQFTNEQQNSPSSEPCPRSFSVGKQPRWWMPRKSATRHWSCANNDKYPPRRSTSQWQRHGTPCYFWGIPEIEDGKYANCGSILPLIWIQGSSQSNSVANRREISWNSEVDLWVST